MKLYIPWSVEGYANGHHPLVEHYARLLAKKFTLLLPDPNMTYEKVAFHVATVANLSARLMAVPGAKPDEMATFMKYRFPYTDLFFPPEAQLTFHHSHLPTTLPGPALFHFENPLTLFIPYIRHGAFNRGYSVTQIKGYKYIKAILGDEPMKAIFSHSRLGLDSLHRLFPDATIRSKLHYIPFQSFMPPANIMAKPSQQDGIIRFLFTNSFHGLVHSFWLRGGVTTLFAFKRLVEQGYPAQLVMISKIPEDLPGELQTFLRSCPHVLYCEERITEERMLQLYQQADIFILPSLGLHSLSLCQAIHHRCYCLCSDAPGVDEFVQDGVNGKILAGTVREKVYFQDRVSQIWLDDYAQYVQINLDNVDCFHAAMVDQIQHITKQGLPPPPSYNPVADMEKWENMLQECLR